MQSLSFRAMNTEVLLALESQDESDEGLRKTQAFIEDCERRFSRFLPDSELSQMNNSAGSWFQASDELFDLLMASKAYYEETGGLFDPSVLPDLKRVGYDVSMDEIRKRGSMQAAAASREPRPGLDSLELDPRSASVRMPEGLQIDLGGIAKGWIVQQAATRLKAHGTAAAVSAGGDMVFAGLPSTEGKWRVRIEDPRDANRTAAMLQVGEGAVVTSSVSKRTWNQHGEKRHHSIDPRTGEPAETEWLSATVIASQADLAEAYAKAFLIGGRREATRLMLQRPHMAVICIDPNGRIFASLNSKEYMNVHGNEPLQ